MLVCWCRYDVTNLSGELQFSPAYSGGGGGDDDDDQGGGGGAVEDLYYSCDNPNEPIAEHSFPARFSSDYDAIFSGCQQGTSCGCIALYRTNQAPEI